jgi:hypothetical protein
VQAGLSFGIESGNPTVRALARDTHCFGDVSDGHAEFANAMHQQSSPMHSETGVTVRHEDLLGCEAANSTMPGGLHASADATNVMAGYS